MDAGRFIFGMGGENLQVAQNAYAVGWFKGKELNMVFGLQLSMARIGRSLKIDIGYMTYSGARLYNRLQGTKVFGEISYGQKADSLHFASFVYFHYRLPPIIR